MNTAIAILRAGRSYDEASKVTGIPADQIMAEWKRLNSKTPTK